MASLRHFIIGDIHGCFEEFQELLGKASLAGEDRIIALGDIVDRGPRSPDVLSFFASNDNASSLMGNHERKHVRAHRGELKRALSQRITQVQFGEDNYPEAVRIMAKFPLFFELEEAILVHGFFEPRVPLQDQRETVMAGTLSGEFHLDKNYDCPWYELYDGEKPVICGHRDYLRTGHPLIHREKVWGIDTSCCRGGRLTGLLLPEFRIVSVPSRANYWESARSDFLDQANEAKPKPVVWNKEAEAKLLSLQEFMREEHKRITQNLGEKVQLHSDEGIRLYAATVADHPLSGWLHQCRLGRLSLEGLKRGIGSPRCLRRLLRRLSERGLEQEEILNRANEQTK